MSTDAGTPTPTSEMRMDNLWRINLDESVNNFARSICGEAANYLLIVERELIALRAVHEAVQAALKEMLISHENLYRSRFGERSNPNDDIVRQQALRTISRPYKLIGCVQHDCEACIARENQYKERCEELTALHAAHEAVQAELAAYDAIINDDGSLTTHADKLTILQDMAHAYKHSSDWEAQEEKLRVAQAEIAALRVAFAHFHVNYGDGSDTCKQCGLDLRDPVHFSEYRDKQIAKYAARKAK